MLTFKALNNQAPDYISELLTLFKLCHALRSSCQTLLAVPKTKMKLYRNSLFPASAPIDFEMQVTGGLRILNHSIFLGVKLKYTCSAGAIEYRDNII